MTPAELRTYGLGRREQFDERSRQWPITAALRKARKPRSYTWRCRANLNQGPDGACVGFGLAHELAARPAEVRGLGFSKARFFYHEAQKIDPWPGGAYEGAKPFYEGTSLLAGLKVGQRLGYYREYRWAFGIEELVMGVGYNGPALLGIPWTTGMYTPDDQNYIHPTGRVVGGHCLLAISVDIRRERFILHNSWGPGWGRKGAAYITVNELAHLLQSGGEAAFTLKRRTNP